MALILNIETATDVCSVSLARDGELLNLRETKEAKSHASVLTVFIEEMLREASCSVNQLDAVAVSMGPGSYTGLRIGVSVAKGISYGASIPLIAVSTLQSLAQHALSRISNPRTDFRLVPMIDARRMEVYTAIFDPRLNQLQETSALILADDSFQRELQHREWYFFGSGSEKSKSILNHPNARFIDNLDASAIGLIALAEEKYKKNNFENTAYFEPFYLKDFIATIPKKMFG